MEACPVYSDVRKKNFGLDCIVQFSDLWYRQPSGYYYAELALREAGTVHTGACARACLEGRPSVGWATVGSRAVQRSILSHYHPSRTGWAAV